MYVRVGIFNLFCRVNTRVSCIHVHCLIGICHPDTVRFKAATLWGCLHEQDALKEYKAKAGSSHDQLSVSPAGFFYLQGLSLSWGLTRQHGLLFLLWTRDM